MKINSNTTAVISNNYLLRTENALTKSTERLSSGKKINNASDNPAGYAISSKMRAQLRSLEKATDNAKTGVNFIETGEGALSEIQDMVQRMNELAVKSANGTMTEADRDAIQQEVNQLCDEIERMASTVEFNDRNILDGSNEFKGYVTDVGTNVKILSYNDAMNAGKYSIDYSTGSTSLQMRDENGVLVYDMDASYDAQTKILSAKSKNGDEEIKLDLAATGAMTGGSIRVDLPKIGAMRVQVGAEEGQVIEMNIPEISLRKMGLSYFDASNDERTIDVSSSQDAARAAIDRIGGALDYVSSVRSMFGAYQNRLEHTVSSLDVSQESLTDSYSTISDTDMASEMTEYTKLQVLQQAGTSMLAQANEFPQQALQLLQ